MANPKPVAEVRIGRVKATVWPNETKEGRTKYNVTFFGLYRDGEKWKRTQSFGRNDLLLLAKVANLAHLAHLRASARRSRRSRVLAGQPVSESGGGRSPPFSEPFDPIEPESIHLSHH